MALALLLLGAAAPAGWLPAPLRGSGGGVLLAQRRAGLVLALPPQPAREGPIVRAPGVLDEDRLRDHLHAGFPSRLTFRVELWSTGGLTNNLEGSAEWEVLVRYDRLDRSYLVARGGPGERPEVVGRFASLGEAAAALARGFQPVLSFPGRQRRYYYAGSLTIATLSANDLDEVEQWLRGELRPAIRGEGNAGTAVARGLRTLVARMIAGPQRTFQARTGTFFVP